MNVRRLLADDKCIIGSIYSWFRRIVSSNSISICKIFRMNVNNPVKRMPYNDIVSSMGEVGGKTLSIVFHLFDMNILIFKSFIYYIKSYKFLRLDID